MFVGLPFQKLRIRSRHQNYGAQSAFRGSDDLQRVSTNTACGSEDCYSLTRIGHAEGVCWSNLINDMSHEWKCGHDRKFSTFL